MVEHEVFDLLADEYPPEPEKVQVVALLSRSGAAVGAGAGTASTWLIAARPKSKNNCTILKGFA